MSNNRYEVMREDPGKSDIFEGKRDRRWYIYDNALDTEVSDGTGETIYFDSYEDAEDTCNEMNEEGGNG